MLQPIDLLKKELAELRVVANRRRFGKIKKEANTLIPAYENAIKFLEAVNGVDTSQHRALHKHDVGGSFECCCPRCKKVHKSYEDAQKCCY